MFQETEYKINNLQNPLIDLDISESNFCVYISGYLEKISRNVELPFGNTIHFGNRTYPLLNDIRIPIVRIIDKETALVLGTNKQYDETNQNNAWIINSNGEVKVSFSTKSAVEDVVVTKDFIVVTYFDETACYGEGIEVYNFEGKLLFGYEELFGKDSVEVLDCYAVALVDENQIIFCPYTEFLLVLFDIGNRKQQVLDIPDPVKGFHAITKIDEEVYFHRQYRLDLEGYDFGIFEWKIGSTQTRKVFEYENHSTRGLPNGRFLAKTDTGYSIISLK